MIAKIQKITLRHEPQPLKSKSITTPSPLTIHPNNPPATKKNTIKTMIPIIPSISITYYLFVSWHNIVTFREKFKIQRNFPTTKISNYLCGISATAGHSQINPQGAILITILFSVYSDYFFNFFQYFYTFIIHEIPVGHDIIYRL